MRETSNYKLSQWDKTDRIQMEDFNADNSKVDAALTGQAAELVTKASHAELEAALPWVKLTEVTSTAAAESVSVTIPNPSLYRELHVYIDCGSGGFRCSLKANGTDLIGFSGVNNDCLTDRIVGMLEITPLQTEGSIFRYCFGVNAGGYKSSSNSFFTESCICSGPLTLTVTSSNSSYLISAEAKFVVYGLKI